MPPLNSHKGQLQQLDQSNHMWNSVCDQSQQWTLSFQPEINLKVKNYTQVENILLSVYRVHWNANFTSCLAQTPSWTTITNTDMPTDEVRGGLRMDGEVHVGEEENTFSIISEAYIQKMGIKGIGSTN